MGKSCNNYRQEEALALFSFSTAKEQAEKSMAQTGPTPLCRKGIMKSTGRRWVHQALLPRVVRGFLGDRDLRSPLPVQLASLALC